MKEVKNVTKKVCDAHFIAGCFECAGEEAQQRGVDRMNANDAAQRRKDAEDAQKTQRVTDEST